MGKRRCRKCDELFDESQFQTYRSEAGGDLRVRHVCIACIRKQRNEWERKQREQFRQFLAGSKKPDAGDEEATVDEPSPAGEIAEPEPTANALLVRRLRDEISRLQAHTKDLERLALSSEAMRELVGSLGSPNVIADPEWLRGASDPRHTTGVGVLMLSDIHFDEVVRSQEIGGCNEFNRLVATQRMRNTFRNSISLLRGHLASANYEGICCVLGGDLVSGNIHDELIETNDATINETILAIEKLLIEGLGGLADEFGRVHVPCVTGNHGRMHKKPRAKGRAHHNFEWLIYQRLAAYFSTDNRITFDIPDGPDAHFNFFDRRYCLTHGDQFQGGGGIGGILVPIMRGISKKQMRQQAIGDPFDVIIMGHWHRYIHMSQLVINGSLKGYDEFASANNFDFEPPQQACWIEHAKHGMTFRMPVLCDKAD